MKKRTFFIDCAAENEQCQMLYKLLTLFIDTAFPPNGSECAQATRASLLVLSAYIKASDGVCEISTRQRPLLKTAIRWYFEDVESNYNQQQALLLLVKKKRLKKQ
jgi:hypothetical protein